MKKIVDYDINGNEFGVEYPTEEVTHFINDNQEAKADAGKPNLTLVPTQIVRDIAEVREYGNRKYGSRDNWKNVELERYIAALYRHLLSVVEDPLSVDPESKIEHYKHIERMKQAGFYNCDCLEAMREYPDKYFDLAIVDPPYGSGGVEEWEKKTRFGPRFDKYKKPGRTGGGYFKKYGKKIIDWDIAPGKEYFDELFRISKHQIIWGGNYFNNYLPSNRNFIIWRKLTISESFTMAMAEYAWTSLNGNAKVFECAPQGTKTEPRFHPTQKPVALYEWLLSQYANKGDKILDTHAGSGSSLIACHRMGFEITAFEIDKEYYQKAKARLEEEKAQIKFNL